MKEYFIGSKVFAEEMDRDEAVRKDIYKLKEDEIRAPFKIDGFLVVEAESNKSYWLEKSMFDAHVCQAGYKEDDVKHKNQVSKNE